MERKSNAPKFTNMCTISKTSRQNIFLYINEAYWAEGIEKVQFLRDVRPEAHMINEMMR